MHVPYIPQQVTDKPSQPSMSLQDIARGIEAAIEAIVHYGKQDLKQVGGTIH